MPKVACKYLYSNNCLVLVLT